MQQANGGAYGTDHSQITCLELRRRSTFDQSGPAKGAEAAGEVVVHMDGGGDRAACHKADGFLIERQRKDSNEYFFHCSTPLKDAEYCGKIMPKKDAAGKELSWEYNYKSGKCQPYDSGCFITTACVEFAGLSDDCFELESLRRFRDDVLLHLPGGADDVRRYYECARRIVDKLLMRERKAAELSYLYTRYILPSAIASRLGLYRLARKLYTTMMSDLAARFPSGSRSLPTSATGRRTYSERRSA